jgi:hypothetical protein
MGMPLFCLSIHLLMDIWLLQMIPWVYKYPYSQCCRDRKGGDPIPADTHISKDTVIKA